MKWSRSLNENFEPFFQDAKNQHAGLKNRRTDMLIRIGFEINFRFILPTPLLMLLHVRPDPGRIFKKMERLQVIPELEMDEFIDGFGNRSSRLLAPPGPLKIRNDAIVLDSGLPDPQTHDAPQIPIQQLPPEVMPFLLGSRYCELEKLSDIAWSLFGQTPEGWPRVQAICDWVHHHVTFGYPFARADRTAFETYQEKKGVCRDFMHLSVALCRCMNIPARYVTGYLGDIGVPPVPCPMDFSAWFQVYLGDRWHNFDARHNMPRIGRVLMACGRDATDVALATSFGKHTLEKFEVWTDELSESESNRLLEARD